MTTRSKRSEAKSYRRYQCSCQAFHHIDHKILVAKINGLDMPHSIKAWVTDFLTNRHQRVKLSSDCYSEWSPVPAGVPQGIMLGPWLFLLMINDLKVDALTWKYVDDTTISKNCLSSKNVNLCLRDSVESIAQGMKIL